MMKGLGETLWNRLVVPRKKWRSLLITDTPRVRLFHFSFIWLMIKLTLIFYDLDTRAVALDKLPQGHNRPISPGLELVYCNYWGKGVVR